MAMDSSRESVRSSCVSLPEEPEESSGGSLTPLSSRTRKELLIGKKTLGDNSFKPDTPYNMKVVHRPRKLSLQYFQEKSVSTEGSEELLSNILKKTPKPKGKDAFSSVHIIRAPGSPDDVSMKIQRQLVMTSHSMGIKFAEYYVGDVASDAKSEYNSIFETASSLVMNGADRSSLIIFVGCKDANLDAYAAFIGMLPFRGVTVALISQRSEAGDIFKYESPSGLFEINGLQAARMGMFPIAAMFGPLEDFTVEAEVESWSPIKLPDAQDGLVTRLPFKIGGLALPMVVCNASYHTAVTCFNKTIEDHYENEVEGKFYPIVSCGETCDALGYGHDIIESFGHRHGYLFTHKSGETYKRHDVYGDTELFSHILFAKKQGLQPLIIAVGGGVNGNSIGVIAALTGSDFVEMPCTPMHFNDATTSAKKAFSLVKDDVILSKNILGAFYLPRIVFCINEMFLTISSANVHATVGEACKTMNMLGIADSATGAQDYHNILGAVEFASDFTKIIKTVQGFDKLVEFVTSKETIAKKHKILCIGSEIRVLISAMEARSDKSITAWVHPRSKKGDVEKIRVALQQKRSILMQEFRVRFNKMDEDITKDIKNFLTIVNKEIVSAKAMFLAYSDPFEKYRALLFEYAHTLGHGIEAFVNGLYRRAEERGITIPPDALRLHGQCVGMAVLWAGAMSHKLNILDGIGLDVHQSLIYLFNRHGGFSFRPLRELCISLGVSQDEMCDGVISVVRRDNKKGYCACSSEHMSVDQLVCGRPGRMLRSSDPNAELRYLVEVDESLQREVLIRAFQGDFDNFADLQEGKLVFVKHNEPVVSTSAVVAEHIHALLTNMYQPSEAEDICLPCVEF